MSFSVPTRSTLSSARACGEPTRSAEAPNDTSNKRVNENATGITILSTCKTIPDVTRRRHPIARVKSREPLIANQKSGRARALYVCHYFIQFLGWTQSAHRQIAYRISGLKGSNPTGAIYWKCAGGVLDNACTHVRRP